MPALEARSIRAGGSPSAIHRGRIDVTSTESPSKTNIPNGQVALTPHGPSTRPVSTTRSLRTGTGGATTNPGRSDRPAPSWNATPPGPEDLCSPASSADGEPLVPPGGTQGSSAGRDALEMGRQVNASSSHTPARCAQYCGLSCPRTPGVGAGCVAYPRRVRHWDLSTSHRGSDASTALWSLSGSTGSG